MAPKKIVIVGAGPLGVGAGARLQERDHQDWVLFEKSNKVGGLAGSETDPQGFTWDRAGHVLFSKDERFNSLLDKKFSGKLFSLERKSYIRLQDRWIAYPFQNNIGHLAPEQTLECLLGLYAVSQEAAPSVQNFEDWIVTRFGRGIASLFMLPYNQKVWAHPLKDMGIYWMNDRVSVVDFQKILSGVILKKSETLWGPNARFFYPRGKGFGQLFEEWASPFSSRIKFDSEVMSIDPVKKTVTLKGKDPVSYDALISSLPLDQLIARMPSAPETVKQAARQLAFHGVYGIGIGLKKNLDWDVCWAYFPETSVPFYRVTHLSKYSPENVPQSDVEHYSSLLCEIPYSSHWPNPKETVIEKTINGLITSGIIEPQDRSSIISTHLMDCPYGYPIPTLQRDPLLAQINPWLEQQNILSRGRFGTWKYEIGNSDHAFMMGWEAVDRVLDGTPEKIFNSAQ